MNPDLWAVVLILATLGWFGVSLLPAFRELFKRTDVTPLRIPGGASDIRFFALSFRKQLDQRLPGLKEAAGGGAAVEGGLDDGTVLRYLPPSASSVALLTEPAGAGSVAVVSESGLRVPAMSEPLKEVYTAGDLEGAGGNVYRALLVDGSATLGESSVVIRWVDVGRDLTVAKGSTLWGRASAGGTIDLASGVVFQRVAAPRIVFGDKRPVATSTVAPAPLPVSPAPLAPLAPPDEAHVSAGRWYIGGDFTVPEGAIVESAVVVSGTLRVRRGARVTGAVKAAVIDAGDDCVFLGALVASDRLILGARCEVAGPIVAEREVYVGPSCRLGDAGNPTIVTALDIRMGRDVVLSGEAWARKAGTVDV